MRASSALRALVLLVCTQLSVSMKIQLGGLGSLAPKPAITGPQHFDLVVLGGGSGGLAASKTAAQLGKTVAVCNFVKPSPAGTTWGLGGTCVNVGCIPKKLMHEAAQLGQSRTDSAWYGWDPAEEDHEWSVLMKNVQNLVKSMSFAYRTQCTTNDVTLFDAFGAFVDPHTVELALTLGLTLTLALILTLIRTLTNSIPNPTLTLTSGGGHPAGRLGCHPDCRPFHPCHGRPAELPRCAGRAGALHHLRRRLLARVLARQDAGRV